MKVAIVSKHKTKKIEKILKKFNFDIVKRNPDFVLCYGGDGTILYSERLFPRIPKIIIKVFSSIYRKYDYTFEHLEKILKKVVSRKYKIIKENKLVTKIKNKKLIGLNEIQVRNKTPIKTLRFSIKVKNKKFENLLGDGVIVSTPFGSTAYYSSTGGKPFKKGIGISFNNLHRKKIKSFVVPENSKIEIKILREPAWVMADNNEKFIEVKKGNKVLIEKAKEKTRFVYIG